MKPFWNGGEDCYHWVEHSDVLHGPWGNQVRKAKRSEGRTIEGQGETLDEGFSTSCGVRVPWYVDLVQGNIKLVPSHKGMVVFAEGVE
jgi:hypothetical protein